MKYAAVFLMLITFVGCGDRVVEIRCFPRNLLRGHAVQVLETGGIILP
jgi:hypothetical protein